ncbi:MAG TPA: long-chain fatty acid--CoA ligase [Jatrophihabitantaceae bacterium]|nr:long-chain fatty acid--CoA ligase [Jatrophihabitantaceae bacterium]
MRELTVPSKAPNPSQHNTADYVYENAATSPDRVTIRRRVDGEWRDVTSGQFADEVLGCAKGLIAAGIEAGDRVALMSKTRYEWTLIDFAVLSIGAVVVPIYETSSAEQVEWILSDSQAKAIFVETDAHRAIAESVLGSAVDGLQVWSIDAGAVATVTAGGTDVADEQVHKRREAVTVNDLASILYTSGTTGRPKGCQLLHLNFITEVSEVTTELDELFNQETSTLLFLPIAHVFGRVIEIGAIASGCTLGHTADVKNLLEDLAGFKPTFVLSVPRVFEKVYNTAKQRAHADGKGKIFDIAERVAIRYSEASERGSVSLPLKAQHAVFDKLVYGKLRAALGGQCIGAISGGAPLGSRLGHFFHGVGVTIYEGYGLTETTAGICVNRPDKLRIGTVGPPVGGVTVHVAEDGELLFKSNLIFGGYWNNEAATSEAIDAEGWFHTGDIGEIDDDGFVKITGRKKELIVTAGGKNVAPAVLEDRVRAHWLVSQCLVVGDAQPFIAALITIDPESFPTWLEQAGRPAETELADVVDDPALHAVVQAAIDDANKAVSKAESIRKFTILPFDWTEATGQLTPSMKLKRNVVQKECADDIAALYS